MNLSVEQLTLSMQKYVAASILDRCAVADCANEDQLRVRFGYSIERHAYMIETMLRLPADVLQDRKAIAHYPDGLWQHIKMKLGRPYRRVVVRLTEHLVYPTVDVPNVYADTVRVYTHAGLDFEMYRGDR